MALKVNCGFEIHLSKLNTVENVESFRDIVQSELTTTVNARLKELGVTEKSPKSDDANTLISKIFDGVTSQEQFANVCGIIKKLVNIKLSEFSGSNKLVKSDKSDKKTEKVDVKNSECVKSIAKITAKVKKDLGLELIQYVKNDGKVSKCYIFKAKDADGTKSLQSLMESDEFKGIVSYKRWACGYIVNEKDIKEFTKKTGIKATKVKVA